MSKTYNGDMPIGIARWIVRVTLEDVEREWGDMFARDLEQAIEALIRDAVARATQGVTP